MSPLTAGLRPVFVVSDYWVPHDNGVALIARLGTMLGANVPALLVTGDTMGMLRQLAA